MGQLLSRAKANADYDKLRLREPQLGPTGEKFEQALVLHAWGDADRRRRFHDEW